MKKNLLAFLLSLSSYSYCQIYITPSTEDYICLGVTRVVHMTISIPQTNINTNPGIISLTPNPSQTTYPGVLDLVSSGYHAQNIVVHNFGSGNLKSATIDFDMSFTENVPSAGEGFAVAFTATNKTDFFDGGYNQVPFIFKHVGAGMPNTIINTNVNQISVPTDGNSITQAISFPALTEGSVTINSYALLLPSGWGLSLNQTNPIYEYSNGTTPLNVTGSSYLIKSVPISPSDNPGSIQIFAVSTCGNTLLKTLPIVKSALINGNSILCGSGTYEIDNLISGSTVTWSVSPGSIVSLTPSGSSVTVSALGDGNIVLSANVTKDGVSQVLNKNITVVNSSSINGYNVSKNGPCPVINNEFVSVGITYNGSNICGTNKVTAIDWQIIPNGPDPYQINWNQGVYNCSTIDKAGFTLTYNPTTNIPITFRFRLQNACGVWSQWSPGYSIFTNSNCSMNYSAFVVSPNPTYSSVRITKMGKSEKNVSIQSYKLYDAGGKLIRSGTVKENESIDVSQLNRGVYYLDVQTNKGTEKHKFMKQ